MEKDSVKINGEVIEFYYRRKRIKNIILRVNNNEIIISLPKREPIKTAREFIIKKYDWIRKAIERNNTYTEIAESKKIDEGENLYFLGKKYTIKLTSNNINRVELDEKYIYLNIKEKYINDKNYIKNVYEKWLKQEAIKLFVEKVNEYQNLMKKYRIPYPEIVVRKMKSRWGSCYPAKNKIVLNVSLIKVPIECTEYVVVHELAHFKHQNHSKAFYEFISQFMPDWKERRKILNKTYTKIIY